MKLFGNKESGHAYKVKLCLEVAGLEHEYQEIEIFNDRELRPKEFRQNSKFSEVPMLIDDGQALVQSNAILMHIARKHQIFGGQDKATFKRCVEWLFWEANKIGMCLPQLRVAAKFDPEYLNPGAKQWVKARYDHDVNLLDAELSDGRAFILGDEPVIADFSLCGYLFFADQSQVEVPSNVQAWLDRIKKLPHWKHPYDLMG